MRWEDAGGVLRNPCPNLGDPFRSRCVELLCRNEMCLGISKGSLKLDQPPLTLGHMARRCLLLEEFVFELL